MSRVQGASTIRKRILDGPLPRTPAVQGNFIVRNGRLRKGKGTLTKSPSSTSAIQKATRPNAGNLREQRGVGRAAPLPFRTKWTWFTATCGKGINAHTWHEETVYKVDLPGNRLEQAKIESERFANPVFRLFHTELETVYEEKTDRSTTRTACFSARSTTCFSRSIPMANNQPWDQSSTSRPIDQGN